MRRAIVRKQIAAGLSVEEETKAPQHEMAEWSLEQTAGGAA